MSDLQLYDESYLIKPNGFINIGALCYSNSLLQCLLSCTSIFKTLIQNKDKPHIKQNLLAQSLINLYNNIVEGKDVSSMNIPIWREILNISQKRLGGIHMSTGQEDAHEGLCMFLESMDNIGEVKRLFQHRYRTQIYCDNCKRNTVDKYETNLTFEVQPTLHNEQLDKFKDRDVYYNRTMTLNDFIRVQNGYVDEKFKCPVCSVASSKFQRTTLTMAPEILPILLKKYHEKINTDFPRYIEIPMINSDRVLKYKLVAQSEHVGNQHGGHYYSVCLRKDINNKLNWYLLNDNSTQLVNQAPTPSTYILFYHIEKIE